MIKNFFQIFLFFILLISMTLESLKAASSASEQLDLAHKLEANGDHDGALKAYKTFVTTWPLVFAASEAQFKIGKIEEDQADFLTAFESFQKLVEKYPNCSYLIPSLDEEFRIANLYLINDTSELGRKISMEKAIALFQRLIKSAPYCGHAAQAQFNIGLAREKEAKYQDAVKSYERLIEQYPESELVPIAQYQIGHAWMRSANIDFDQNAVQKGIAGFQHFIVNYPDSNKITQVHDNMNQLER